MATVVTGLLAEEEEERVLYLESYSREAIPNDNAEVGGGGDARRFPLRRVAGGGGGRVI